MSVARRLGVVVVGGLLLLSLGGANMAMTAERTALNADYVSNTLQEEGVYQEVADEAVPEVVEDLSTVRSGQRDRLPSEIDLGSLDREAVADRAITEQYVASQAESNLEALYAYLHGETTQLDLVVDTRPLQSNLATAIGQQAASVDAAELVEVGGAAADTPVPVDQRRVATMLESRSGFDRVKRQFRSDVREDVRRETGASGSALDRQVRQALDRMASESKSTLETTTRRRMEPSTANVTNATIEMQFAVVDALATDEGYATFSSRLDRAEQRLATAAGRLAVQQMDRELNGTIDLSQHVEGNVEQQLREGTDVVQRIDTLSLALPLAALLLIAVAYGVTRSIHRTSTVTATALVVAGLLGVFVAFVLRTTFLQFAGDALSTDRPTVSDAVLDLVDGVLGTLGSQSLFLLAAGGVLYALVYADKRRMLDGLKARAAATTGVGDPSNYGGRTGGGSAPPQGQQPNRSQGEPPTPQQHPNPNQQPPTGSQGRPPTQEPNQSSDQRSSHSEGDRSGGPETPEEDGSERGPDDR